MKIILLSLLCFLGLGGSPLPLQATESAELPIYTFPKAGNKPLLVYLTGDGGMNSFSKALMTDLNNQGYALVALDTRKYFWDKKTPVQFAKDMKTMIEQHMKSWNKNSFALIGYSFGADVGAFLPPLLPETTANQLDALVLLSPGFSTGFVTKISNMLGMGSTDGEPYKVYPQLLRCPAPVVCVFGKDENSDFYKALKPTVKLKKLLVPGSHKYNDDVKLISKVIIQAI
jgi:type IV secretory pathway VirJ component